MIQVTLTNLMLLGMAIGVVMLGIIWLIAVWKERYGERRIRQDLVCCRICGHVYENAEKRRLSACPQCGSLNEPTKPKPI
jgi:predicted Zn-ribbon and HTH transcriptional regulator